MAIFLGKFGIFRLVLRCQHALICTFTTHGRRYVVRFKDPFLHQKVWRIQFNGEGHSSNRRQRPRFSRALRKRPACRSAMSATCSTRSMTRSRRLSAAAARRRSRSMALQDRRAAQAGDQRTPGHQPLHEGRNDLQGQAGPQCREDSPAEEAQGHGVVIHVGQSLRDCQLRVSQRLGYLDDAAFRHDANAESLLGMPTALGVFAAPSGLPVVSAVLAPDGKRRNSARLSTNDRRRRWRCVSSGSTIQTRFAAWPNQGWRRS